MPSYSLKRKFVKKSLKKNKKTKKETKTSEINIEKMNWIEIYNRLFEVINVQGDASTYFSGPRFINTLKEFNQYHPDYTQYISLRNEQGKSTSRRIFYYDIIMELDESTRVDFINRILEMVEPFEKEKVIPIRALIKGENPTIKKPKQENVKENVGNGFHIIFLGYRRTQKMGTRISK